MKLHIREGSENYACSVVKIEHLFSIEGADKIQRALVHGNDIVVSINVKLGDIMLYFTSGTKLNKDYCSYNNLLTDAEQNKDKVKGYISHKQFRVKALKLRGIISNGILMPLESLGFNSKAWDNKLQVGDEFTDINDISICEKYVVTPARNSNPGGKIPKIARFDRLVENQFILHNDTSNLRKNIHLINPNDIIGIHYKKHGTSAVFGNVLTKRVLKWYEKLLKKIGVKVQETEYDIIYSSRKVVKNQYINTEQTNSGFYNEDIWGTVKEEIKDLIPKNWTLYGEILGFLPNGGAIQSMSSKPFDYGCKPGEHKFYVYKISVINEDGHVIYLSDKQIKEYCDKVGLLYSDTFIYYGKAEDLYTDININEHWHENFLEKLEEEYNEKDCYMCINKQPEEGIVVRIEKSDEYLAFKLKSKRFLLGESDEQENDQSNLEDEQ